jgi:hypothetical protein
MPRSNSTSTLLANREVSICIDSHMLSASLVLSLASVRLKPQLEVLTSVVERFAKQEVSPIVQIYLAPQGKENCPLYRPGCCIPRDVIRLVQIAIEEPLLHELEQFVLDSRPTTAELTKVELLMRTTADSAPVFTPVQSSGIVNRSTSPTEGKPAKESKPNLCGMARQVRTNSSAVACGLKRAFKHRPGSMTFKL